MALSKIKMHKQQVFDYWSFLGSIFWLVNSWQLKLMGRKKATAPVREKNPTHNSTRHKILQNLWPEPGYMFSVFMLS